MAARQLRHCERSEAIQNPYGDSLDCFVAKAPRNDGIEVRRRFHVKQGGT